LARGKGEKKAISGTVGGGRHLSITAKTRNLYQRGEDPGPTKINGSSASLSKRTTLETKNLGGGVEKRRPSAGKIRDRLGGTIKA